MTAQPTKPAQVERDMIAAAIVGMTDERFASWAAAHSDYPNSYRSSVESAYAKADRVIERLSTQPPAAELERKLAAAEAEIETARIKISGGLCYSSAEAKHEQLKDADKVLAKALAQIRNGGGG